MSMSEVILRGSTNAPAEGSSGAFYGGQFVFSHVDWLIKMGQVHTDSNSHNPVLPVRKVRKNGFVYLYMMNMKGQWESKYFTTETIEKGPKELLTNEELLQNRSDLIKTGIAKAPKVPGGATGRFYPFQFVPTRECWKRDTEIAFAYVGDDNIAMWVENGYSYWYYFDRKTGFWHSMFFTSRAKVLGGE